MRFQQLNTIVIILVAASLLLSCAPQTLSPSADAAIPVKPGDFTDYRMMAYLASQSTSWPGVPEDVQNQVRVCSVDMMMSSFDVIDLETLNAVAMGSRQMTAREVSDIVQRASTRSGQAADLPGSFKRTCPDVIEKMDSYGQHIGAWRFYTDNTTHIYPSVDAVMRHVIEIVTPDKYPVTVRRQLLDCLAWAVAKDIPPIEQASLLEAVNTKKSSPEVEVALRKWLGHDRASQSKATKRVRASMGSGCPDLAKNYPDVIY